MRSASIPTFAREPIMSLSNPRLVLKQVALGLFLALTTSTTAYAGLTWGEVSPAPVPTQQVVAPSLMQFLLRPRPMYISGYAGTTYPPVGTRWRAMRANYAQPGVRPWFAKLKQLP
jgi:hypothetical protein